MVAFQNTRSTTQNAMDPSQMAAQDACSDPWVLVQKPQDSHRLEYVTKFVMHFRVLYIVGVPKAPLKLPNTGCGVPPLRPPARACSSTVAVK